MNILQVMNGRKALAFPTNGQAEHIDDTSLDPRPIDSMEKDQGFDDVFGRWADDGGNNLD